MSLKILEEQKALLFFASTALRLKKYVISSEKGLEAYTPKQRTRKRILKNLRTHLDYCLSLTLSLRELDYPSTIATI